MDAWIELTPKTKGGPGRKRQNSARLSRSGVLFLSMEAGALLRASRARVAFNRGIKAIRLTPTSEDDPKSYKFSDADGMGYRMYLTEIAKQPGFVGAYTYEMAGESLVLTRRG